jgi:hypothetical protein
MDKENTSFKLKFDFLVSGRKWLKNGKLGGAVCELCDLYVEAKYCHHVYAHMEGMDLFRCSCCDVVSFFKYNYKKFLICNIFKKSHKKKEIQEHIKENHNNNHCEVYDNRWYYMGEIKVIP